MDGHYSHILKIRLFKVCIESGKDIRLVCLPSGQTDKLQLLDSSPFGTLKPKWSSYKSFYSISTARGKTNMIEFAVRPEVAGIMKKRFPEDLDIFRATVDKELVKFDAQWMPEIS
ncbi:hypothetical protein RvY_11695 [Ramazzottius varieornatus]|uniref:DDE-1 domain-containing protein n=1 Tax=Ramazzottius varieornatus TaxID=947166 RepID=A0A1D1VH09_RAMVA|nr:hypothetical protein RvY_11695 [Ramazzottius varieornatus]